MANKALVFDLDGTLFDTHPEISEAVITAVRSHGIDVNPSEELLRSYMGRGLSRFVKRVMTQDLEAEPDAKIHKEVLATAMDNYRKLHLTNNSLYPHVEQMLVKYQTEGWKLAVVTNKLEEFTLPILAKFLADIKFDCVLSKDNVVHPKPHPEALETILTKLDVSKDAAIYVGDTKIDIEAGKAAKYKATLAVNYGYYLGDINKLGADYVINSFAELPQVIAKIDLK